MIVGGIIPDQDIEALKKQGVAAVFQPGTAMDDIVKFIRANVKAARALRFEVADRTSKEKSRSSLLRTKATSLRKCQLQI